MTLLVGASTRRPWLLVVAIVAGAFGIATILAGGRVIFGPDSARVAVGHYVPFLVWFNFLAGFAYLGAAAGIALGRRWSAQLAAGIAAATALAFLALGAHVLSGVAFELRSVAAMSLRTGLWATIAFVTRRWLLRPAPQPGGRPCSRRSE